MMRTAECHSNRKHEAGGLCAPCYRRAYYQKNRVKLLADQKEYREENREKLCTYGRIYRQNNRERFRRKNQVYRQSNRQRVNEWAKQVRRAIKLEVLFHYCSETFLCCAVCGETKIGILEIDHINGGGSKHRRELGVLAGSQFYYWLRKNKYPEGYRVLCRRCNAKRNSRIRRFDAR